MCFCFLPPQSSKRGPVAKIKIKFTSSRFEIDRCKLIRINARCKQLTKHFEILGWTAPKLSSKCWNKHSLKKAVGIKMQSFTLSTSPIFMDFWRAVFGSSFCIIITFLMLQSLFNYHIKKLIMMQKLKPRTIGLKPTKIGQVDGIRDAQKIPRAKNWLVK